MGIIKPKEGYIMSFKKLSIVLLVVMMVLGGCSAPANEEASGQQQHENTTMMPDDTELEDNIYKYGTPVTFDNIVFTITEGTINPVKETEQKTTMRMKTVNTLVLAVILSRQQIMNRLSSVL